MPAKRASVRNVGKRRERRARQGIERKTAHGRKHRLESMAYIPVAGPDHSDGLDGANSCSPRVSGGPEPVVLRGARRPGDETREI